MNVREKIEKLVKEKRSLPECVRRREIEIEIRKLSEESNPLSTEPSIIVKYAGKVVGRLEYNVLESSWFFKANDGSKTEIGFHYHEARSWASMNGYQIKVESV
jgi:hypothetical protein